MHDSPWEGSGSGYHTVIQDGDLYRLYHRGSHLEVSPGRLGNGNHRPFYCYAEWTDGDMVGASLDEPANGIVDIFDILQIYSPDSNVADTGITQLFYALLDVVQTYR